MIKNLTTILILFCLLFAFEPQNIEQTHFNHSSVFDSEYNKTNKLFYNTTFNRGYNLLEFEGQYWNNYEWINSSKYLYTYDDDNQVEYIYQTWDELDWLNYFKSTYTYNEDNNVIESLNYTWNGLDWDVPGGRMVAQYDNGNQIEQLYQLWDNDNSDWLNYSKSSFLYDDDNQIEYLYQIWNESDWLNYSKSTYTYNEDNNVIESLNYIWNGLDWDVPGTRIVSQYDNGNQFEQLYQLWDNDNSDWINYSKYSFLYDDDNQIEYLYQLWNELDWLNYFKSTYTYNEDNNLIESMNFLWDGYDWNISGRLINYIYEENNLDIDFEDDMIDLSYNLYKPYPNPFNPTTTISFSVPNYDFISIKVYDINGKIISTLVKNYFNQGAHSVMWDGSHLSSGQYLIKMESNSYTKTQMISLIK